jgi:hypothetical protein
MTWSVRGISLPKRLTPDEDLEEEEVWLESPVMGAEELLRFFRVRELLRA